MTNLRVCEMQKPEARGLQAGSMLISLANTNAP